MKFSPERLNNILKHLRQKAQKLSRRENQQLRGTCYLMKRKCGNKTCKCSKTRYRHKTISYSLSDKGKTKMIHLNKESPDKIIKIKKMIKEYQKNKELFQEVIHLTSELETQLKTKMQNLTINITEIIGKK